MLRNPLPIALAAVMTVTGCSSAADSPAESADERIVPAETARMLSLGGHLIGNDETAYELSLGCATSLRVTAQAMQALAGQANSAEIALIGRAADVYEDRAVASSEGPSERQIRAQVARDAQSLKDERSEQAQLAIVCLRSLG